MAIQIIAWVSVFAMAIGTAALILVLSVFNGFEGFIKNLYSGFYPQIKITPVNRKTFQPTEKFMNDLSSMVGIKAISQTCEEKVLLKNGESQVIATIKGVDSNYNKTSRFNEYIKYGHIDFSQPNNIAPAALGIGVSNRLGATEETHLPITCYAFRKEAVNMLDMASSYSTILLEVNAIYVLQDEIDNQYVFVPLHTVQELLNKPGSVSAIEVALNPSVDEEMVKKNIQQIEQANLYTVETRFEQNKTLYFILKSERWAVYSILTLMLIIASFNIVGCMSMFVLEKKKDISILKAMGMTSFSIQLIFMATGILLSLIGACIGAIVALIICLLQQHFGFVKLGAGGLFLLEAYPIQLNILDFVLVLGTVIVIAFLASWYPATRAGNKAIELRAN